MHVFVTGATGFVGHYVLGELIRTGHTARCLLRRSSIDKLPIDRAEIVELEPFEAERAAGAKGAPGGKVEVVFGDVADAESLKGRLAGCDAVIHLVGVIDENRRRGVTFERMNLEATRHIVNEARAAGVARFVHMSANGARGSEDASGYHRTKWQAEEIVRGAGFAGAVIFRPTIIFGDPGPGRPEFASRMAETLIRPFPILPVLGDGRYRLQPIHISAVAAAFVQALTLEVPEGEVPAYCVAGEEEVEFDDLLDRITIAMGRRPKRKMHLPLWMSKSLVSTAGAAGLLPISPAQFQMLQEGNTCDPTAFRETFEYSPVPFEPAQMDYLAP